MTNAGPFSLDALMWTDEALPSCWLEAMRSLAQDVEKPLTEVLRRLPPEQAAHSVWRGWSEQLPLLDYQSSVAPEWDRQDRALLLPLLWSCVDQACWQHRYSLAERLAKRCLARTMELPSLCSQWAVLCYLALARTYLAQERLELAEALLANLPKCDCPEVAALVGLHRGELLRRQGFRFSARLEVHARASQEFDKARGTLGAPCLSLDAQCQGQAWRGLEQGDALFAQEDWENAAHEYRRTALELSQQRPGQSGAGPFAAIALAWPCLPGLAHPWPIAFSACGQAQSLEAYLYCQGRLAGCLRNQGLAEEARREANLAKAVRFSSGRAHLVNVNEKTFPDTAAARVRLEAPHRRPTWLSWDSARGDMEVVSPGNLSKKLLLLGPGGQFGEEFIQEFFAGNLPEGPVEFRLYGRKATSSQLESVPYSLWVGFEHGPPLYLPVST